MGAFGELMGVLSEGSELSEYSEFSEFSETQKESRRRPMGCVSAPIWPPPTCGVGYSFGLSVLLDDHLFAVHHVDAFGQLSRGGGTGFQELAAE